MATKREIEDYKRFYVEGGQIGFNPKNNKKVVEDCIAKHDKFIQLKKKIYAETIGERADAVAMYLMHISRGKQTSVEKYFTRTELARLRGEQIRYEVRNNAKLFITN